jgi:hypothetical protein
MEIMKGNRGMGLWSRIVHYRLMIRRGYHPEFFRELINKTLEKQRQWLEHERKTNGKRESKNKCQEDCNG